MKASNSLADKKRDSEHEKRLAALVCNSSPYQRFDGGDVRVANTVYAYERVSSTMDIARELALQGASEGTLVVAECQDKGRGRFGRAWLSPEGGVYFSLILRPQQDANKIPQLSLIAGLSTAEAIRELTGLFPVIRWPNDVLLGEKKVAGILAESATEHSMQITPRLRSGQADHPPKSEILARSLQFAFSKLEDKPQGAAVILGIGLNVATPLEALPESATSLSETGAKHCNSDQLIVALCQRLQTWYDVWMAHGFGPIREALRPWIGAFGQVIHVSAGLEQLVATATDIDEEGRLIVRLDSGLLRTFEMGEVTLLR